MLKLAGPDAKASYVAWYFALTGVVYGICTVAGGGLYQWLNETKPTWLIGSWRMDHNDLVFAGGFLLRVLAIVWLLPLQEMRSQRPDA